MTILVPRGAEAAAVRRARTAARIVELPAGAAAASALPSTLEGDVVVLGLCGALRELRAGEVVAYRRIAGAHGTLALDAGALATFAGGLSSARAVDACSSDRVVTTIAARRALADRFDADVVDMEGGVLAAALAARQLRFAMIRVVSDDATRELPALENAITAAGGLDAVRVALAFVRQPRAAFAFVRDVRRALRTLTLVAAVIAAE